MSAGGGRNRMKCRLGLARSSGTESSRRPPRVVGALVAPLLSVPLQPKWGPGARVVYSANVV